MLTILRKPSYPMIEYNDKGLCTTLKLNNGFINALIPSKRKSIHSHVLMTY